MMRQKRARAVAAALAALGLFVSAPAWAQEQAIAAHEGEAHVESAGNLDDVDEAPAVARKLFADLVCMCGGCKRETLLACTCSFARKMREKVMGLLAGEDLKSEKGEAAAYLKVRDAFMKEYGGQLVLTVPIDAGFNKLAWAVPWTVFGVALILVFVVGRKFVLRGRAETAAASAAAANAKPVQKSEKDLELEDRLEDELRDID